MNELFNKIFELSRTISTNYNVNLEIFLIIYILSFIPFYTGYFLMIYGTTRKLKFSDIFKLRFKNNLQWDSTAKIGLFVHLFGRIMPYAYIAFFGKNLPILINILVWLVIIISILFFVKKLYIRQGVYVSDRISVRKVDIVSNSEEGDILWKIYNETFEPVNKISPCKQSLDFHHFSEVLSDPSVYKYILYDNDRIIGIGLVTNDFKNTPWISEDYFKVNFPHEYNNKSIFYFVGLAIHKESRGNKYSIYLIEHIIDNLPNNSILGFDHSRNINPILHQFTRIVKQAHVIKRNRIDQQHYHVVRRSK